MEDWQLEFEWLRVRHFVKKALKTEKLPDLNLVLLMVGIQTLGYWQGKFTKEEKQDLMHIGVCELLSHEGYFEFIGRDADNWPQYNQKRHIDIEGEKKQEHVLIENAIRFFKELDKEISFEA